MPFRGEPWEDVGERIPSRREEASVKSWGRSVLGVVREQQQSHLAAQMRDRMVGNETEMEAGASLVGYEKTEMGSCGKVLTRGVKYLT